MKQWKLLLDFMGRLLQNAIVGKELRDLNPSTLGEKNTNAPKY